MEKQVNYTDEMVSEMVERYTADKTRETVEALAEEFGKSYRSVVAKLSNVGVYEVQPKTSKDGSPVIRKEQLVEAVETMLGIEVPSLEKATKQDLFRLVEAVSVNTASVEAA